MERPFLFTRKDLLHLFQMRKELYMRLLAVMVFFAFGYFLIQPPEYTASATFKCSSGGQTQDELVESLLPSTKTCSTQSVLESRTLLRRASEKMGCMLRVKRPWWQVFCRTVQGRLYAEMGIALPIRDRIIFSQTVFPGDQLDDFFIIFNEKREFSVLDSSKKPLFTGKTGVKVGLEQGSFIVKESSRPVLNHLYKIRPVPWTTQVRKAYNHLHIERKKKDKNVLCLFFSDHNSERAARFLNCLMDFYQSYLLEENERIVKDQIVQLQTKREELTAQYEKALEERSFKLTNALAEDTCSIQLTLSLDEVSLEMTKKLLLQCSEEKCLVEEELQKQKPNFFSGKKPQKKYLGLEKQKALLESKIDTLEQLKTHLLLQEKEGVEKQLVELEGRKYLLPEKWKKENQLRIQRELSVGVAETLAQLSETKSTARRLSHVESRPIDKAFAPYKASREYGFLLAPLIAIFGTGLVFAYHVFRWVLRGVAITESSAKQLGAYFCGYLQDLTKRKQAIRKVAGLIASHKIADKAVCTALVGQEKTFAEEVAHSLFLRDQKVLLIECISSTQNMQKGRGLYAFLSGEGPAKVYEEKGIDRIFAGDDKEHYVELLSKGLFAHFIEVKKPAYDAILLSVAADIADPVVDSLKEVCELFIAQKSEIFFDEISSLPAVAVVLTR